MSQSPVSTVITVVVIGVVGLIGVLIASQFLAAAGIGSASTAVEPVTGQAVTVESGVDSDTDIDVSATTETGIAVDGGGYVDASAPTGWDSGAWSVFVAARADPGSDSWDPAGTHNVVAVDNSTLRLDYHNGSWQAWYRNSSHSALVRVPVNDLTTTTPLTATFDDGQLTLATPTESASAAMTTATADRGVARNWVGMVDELRFIDGAASDQSISQYHAAPADPLDAETHRARWLFDAGRGSTATGYYNATDAALRGSATWGAGVSDLTLTAGSDYQLSFGPLAITTVSGGQLDGAPVVFVDAAGAFGGTIRGVTGGLADALALLPVLMLVLLATIVLTTVRRLQP